ncbi:MAG: hypothetical protein ACRCUI_01135 [Polymorphobacter sp.]
MLAALGCYTISLKVSSARADVDKLRAELVADSRDIRMLQSELRTRARLPELQRWNDAVLALSPPSAQQFVRDSVQLASYAPGAVAATAPVAQLPARAPSPPPAKLAPVTAAPLLPVVPQPTRQLAPGMKSINYTVPAAESRRSAASAADFSSVAPAMPAKQRAMVASAGAGPKALPGVVATAPAGLDSSVIEAINSAAGPTAKIDNSAAAASDAKAPMQ